jgi:hypothetical protein
MYRRTLAEVESSRLESDLVSRSAHLTAEGIDLIYEMTLCRAADRGITGHISELIEREREESCVDAESGACECRFDTRVTASDDGNTCL